MFGSRKGMPWYKEGYGSPSISPASTEVSTGRPSRRSFAVSTYSPLSSPQGDEPLDLAEIGIYFISISICKTTFKMAAHSLDVGACTAVIFPF